MAQYYTAEQRQTMAQRSYNKRLKQPGRQQAEKEFAEKYADATDKELYDYVKKIKRSPKKRLKAVSVVGCCYLTERLGEWRDIIRRVDAELLAERVAGGSDACIPEDSEA